MDPKKLEKLKADHKAALEAKDAIIKNLTVDNKASLETIKTIQKESKEEIDTLNQLMKEMEDSAGASVRPAEDDPFGKIKVPTGEYLIISDLRFKGETLAPKSTSALKGLSADEIKKLKEKQIIR